MQVEIDGWLAELVPRFLANRARELDELDAALLAGDRAAIKAIGHRIRGSASGYGFLELADAGARLEASADTAAVEELRAQIRVISDHGRTVEVVYR